MAVLAASTLVAAATSAQAMTVYLRATDLTGDRVYSDPANGLDFELPETLLGRFTYVTPIDPTINSFSSAVVARYALEGLEPGIDGGLVADSPYAEVTDFDDTTREDNFRALGSKVFRSSALEFQIGISKLDEALDPAGEPPGINDLNAAEMRTVFLEYRQREVEDTFSQYDTVEFSATEFAAPVPAPPAVRLLGLGLGAMGALGARLRAG